MNASKQSAIVRLTRSDTAIVTPHRLGTRAIVSEDAGNCVAPRACLAALDDRNPSRSHFSPRREWLLEDVFQSPVAQRSPASRNLIASPISTLVFDTRSRPFQSACYLPMVRYGQVHQPIVS
nr:hypothetical protein CFP56_73982 [Quercus suber]